MAIDASIALGIKPVQIENPLNNMVKMYGIKNDMQTNEMNRLKMAETQRAQAQAEDTRNFFRQPGFNVEKMTPAQDAELVALNPDFYEKLKSKQTLQRTQESEAAKRSQEIEGMATGHYADLFSKITNPDEAHSLIAHQYANPAMKNAPFHATSEERAHANVPKVDMNTPEGQQAFQTYKDNQSLGAKEHAERQLLSFAVEGGNYVGRNKITGAIVSSSPISLTAEQAMYAPTDLEAKQARYKALAKKTADQADLIARTSGLGLTGTVEMLTEQQKARTAEQEVLRGEIEVLQKQGQSAKNTTIAPLQLLNELDLLVKNGQGNSQRAKDVRGLIEKEKHIAEGVEPLTEAGRELAGGLVGMGFMPSSRATVALNAAALAGVTPKQFVTNKANLSALTKITQNEAQSGAFASAFDQNAKAVLDMAGKVGKTGIPIIDEYFANPLSRATGKNPELAAYGAFIKATANEWGKLVSSATGSTILAQSEIKRIEKLLNEAQSKEQVREVLSSMDLESLNRKWSFEAAKAKLLGETPPEPPVNPRATPKLITKVIDGKTYIKSEDGQWRAK